MCCIESTWNGSGKCTVLYTRVKTSSAVVSASSVVAPTPLSLSSKMTSYSLSKFHEPSYSLPSNFTSLKSASTAPVVPLQYAIWAVYRAFRISVLDPKNAKVLMRASPKT